MEESAQDMQSQGERETLQWGVGGVLPRGS